LASALVMDIGQSGLIYDKHPYIYIPSVHFGEIGPENQALSG